MLLDSAAHFMSFNLKPVSITRQLVPKTTDTQEHRISFVWQHRHILHIVFIEEHVYHCGNNIGVLKTNKFNLNTNIYLSNFIIVSQRITVF